MNTRQKIIYQIFVLLEEGNRFKEMWKGFKLERGDTYCILDQPDKGTIKDDMDNFEKKYFPKTESE